jgi:WD40 repeat protein
LAAATDGSLRRWDIDTAAAAGLVTMPPANALAADLSGDWVAAGGVDGVLRVLTWPPTSSADLAGHGGHVSAVAVSLDGKLIVTGCADKYIRLFDGAEGTAIRSLSTSPDAVAAVAVNGNASLVAGGTTSGAIKLYSAVDGVPLGSLSGHKGAITSVDFHGDGEQLASAAADGTIRLWTLPEPPRTLDGHTASVKAVAIAADGSTVATASDDKSVRVWGLGAPPEDEKAKVESLRIEQPDAPTSVALRADGKQLATGDINGLLRLFDPATGATMRTLGAHHTAISALDYHRENQLLL